MKLSFKELIDQIYLDLAGFEDREDLFATIVYHILEIEENENRDYKHSTLAAGRVCDPCI